MNGGTTFEIVFPKYLNDSQWHFVYWEVNSQGIMLSVDGKEVADEQSIIMPQLSRWVIGGYSSYACLYCFYRI